MLCLKSIALRVFFTLVFYNSIVENLGFDAQHLVLKEILIPSILGIIVVVAFLNYLLTCLTINYNQVKITIFGNVNILSRVVNNKNVHIKSISTRNDYNKQPTTNKPPVI